MFCLFCGLAHHDLYSNKAALRELHTAQHLARQAGIDARNQSVTGASTPPEDFTGTLNPTSTQHILGDSEQASDGNELSEGFPSTPPSLAAALADFPNFQVAEFNVSDPELPGFELHPDFDGDRDASSSSSE